MPPLATPRVPATSAVPRSTPVVVLPLPTKSELVRVSETWASVKLPVKVMLPAADNAMLPLALTAKVPLASGSV